MLELNICQVNIFISSDSELGSFHWVWVGDDQAEQHISCRLQMEESSTECSVLNVHVVCIVLLLRCFAALEGSSANHKHT